MIDNILTAMKDANILLTYTSLNSGKDKKVVGTLQKDKWVLQHATNDSITFWDVNNEKYESLQCSTITAWDRTEVPE